VKKLRITWKRSSIGYDHRQRRIVRSLGLRRLHQTVVHDDTPTIRGMLRKVPHLVEVVEEE
jgi:large subunit ribosomal protein L30